MVTWRRVSILLNLHDMELSLLNLHDLNLLVLVST